MKLHALLATALLVSVHSGYAYAGRGANSAGVGAAPPADPECGFKPSAGGTLGSCSGFNSGFYRQPNQSQFLPGLTAVLSFGYPVGPCDLPSLTQVVPCDGGSASDTDGCLQLTSIPYDGGACYAGWTYADSGTPGVIGLGDSGFTIGSYAGEVYGNELMGPPTLLPDGGDLAVVFEYVAEYSTADSFTATETCKQFGWNISDFYWDHAQTCNGIQNAEFDIPEIMNGSGSDYEHSIFVGSGGQIHPVAISPDPTTHYITYDEVWTVAFLRMLVNDVTADVFGDPPTTFPSGTPTHWWLGNRSGSGRAMWKFVRQCYNVPSGVYTCRP